MENVSKHKDIKSLTTEERRNYLVSEPNYYLFSENLLAIEMKRSHQILTSKPVYLGLSLKSVK